MTNTVVDTLLDRLTTTFGAAADPARAAEMAAYMRNQFAFLGIPTPRRRALGREVLAAGRSLDPGLLGEVASRCWELPDREYQYFGCDLLLRHARRLPADLLVGPEGRPAEMGKGSGPEGRRGGRGTVERLITNRSWWDTVDPLATRVVGAIVARHPELGSIMDRWIESENRWLVRTALLHQLHHGDRTDTGRLLRYCRARAGHPDFFVRKAIGWALRHYASTDPDLVRGFLADHGDELSPLSRREASKHLG